MKLSYFRFLFSLLWFPSILRLYRFITSYKPRYFLLKHIRYYGTKEDFGFKTGFMIFAESCWRRNCWRLNRYKESIFQEKLLKFAIICLPNPFLMSFYSRYSRCFTLKTQKKMTIKYGLPNVDRENTWKIFRPFLFAFRDIMLSKALSHDAICKETFIVNLLKKFYLLFSQFLKYAFYTTWM